MQHTNLSIIIVNYQSWGYLEECLLSFKRYPLLVSYEIIVVDNDSKDGEFELFHQRHPEISLFKNSSNLGFSHGCNLGASKAIGDKLLFLNPDTELTKDRAIDEMCLYLDNQQDVGIVSCRNKTPSGIGKEDRFLSPWLLFGITRFFYKTFKKKKLALQYPTDGNIHFPGWVTGSVVLIKSQLFSQIGGWNSKRYWMYSEDPDICYKVHRLGKKISLLTHLTINHVGGGTSEPNLPSVIRYKTEDTISKHNYIQENSNGLSRPILHILYFLKMQSSSIDIFLSLILLRKDKVKIKSQTLINCWKYYLQAALRKSWKNIRLDEIQ